MNIMCTNFQGFGKPVFNNQPVNVQKLKRFVTLNLGALPQNLIEDIY